MPKITKKSFLQIKLGEKNFAELPLQDPVALLCDVFFPFSGEAR